MNVLLQTAWTLLLVSRTCESWCGKEQLLPESTCNHPRSPLAQHSTRTLTKSVSYLNPPDSVSLLTLKFLLFVPFITSLDNPESRGQARWNYFATPLLHCCWMRHITLCHRVSCGWIRYKKASAVVGCVKYESPLHSWSIICCATVPFQHCRVGSWPSNSLSAFHFNQPCYGSRPFHKKDIRLEQFIKVLWSWSYRFLQALIMITINASISHADRLAYWWSYYICSSIIAFLVGCSKWADGAIADCQGVGTSATRGQFSIRRCRVSHIIPSNAPSSSWPPFFYV